uniref:NADH-ubiquinone oxidoreductase chain 2 n=1 Tax=Waoraniella jarlinsoni TaxID=2597004 RepID=A0A8K2AU23_9NEOP|nr:NADH dehydrogenase subunit 2 [Waoraniella jarlinsoni]
MMNNLNLMFFMMTILSSLISISSSSWFSIWMGLEINMVSFIPLMIMFKNAFSNEAALKYFLIQASSSAFFLMSCMLNSFFMINMTNLMTSNYLTYLLMIPIMIKLGVVPFHQWFINVTQGLNWLTMYMIMTWQKIAPILVLNYIYTDKLSILLFILFSALIGAVGGLSQTLLKKILGYSSISHLSWMLAALMISKIVLITYIIFYMITNAFVVLIFFLNNLTQFNQINTKNFFSPFSISMFSLGGLPPFLGFFPKMLVLKNLLLNNTSISLILIMSSLITLFFYIRITIKSLTLSSNSQKWLKQDTHAKKWMIIYMLLTLISSLMLIFINLLM